MESRRTLTDRISSALLWAAAFCYSAGIFFSATLALRVLPETEPVAVGLVTILHYSKARDYAALALFFVLVPSLTLLLREAGVRLIARLRRRVPGDASAISFALALPFLLAPLFYLTTGKVGWVILLPPAIATAAVELLRVWRSSSWLRRMFADDLGGHHALIFSASSS